MKRNRDKNAFHWRKKKRKVWCHLCVVFLFMFLFFFSVTMSRELVEVFFFHFIVFLIFLFICLICFLECS